MSIGPVVASLLMMIRNAAPKVILYCRSQYFREIIDKDPNANEIVVADISYILFEHLVYFFCYDIFRSGILYRTCFLSRLLANNDDNRSTFEPLSWYVELCEHHATRLTDTMQQFEAIEQFGAATRAKRRKGEVVVPLAGFKSYKSSSYAKEHIERVFKMLVMLNNDSVSLMSSQLSKVVNCLFWFPFYCVLTMICFLF